jgi:prepilin-type processing-associated H-X9-DG protein/prepilin-type N-terminal cleavage/methylation domain-containing protein
MTETPPANIASQRSRRAGFTLVELLVVIGIIAILVGVLLPVLGSTRRSARTLQCASSLRQFGQANAIYVNEQKGWCVPVKTAINSVVPEQKGPFFSESLTYIPWYANTLLRKHLAMPVPPRTRTGSGTNYSTSDWVENWSRQFLCPEASASQMYKNGTVTHSYGWNRVTLGHIGDPTGVRTLSPAFNAGLFVKQSQVKRSAEKIIALDGNWFYLDGPWMDGGSPASSGSGPAETVASPADWRTKWNVFGDREPGGPNPITVSYRHKQGANVLFYDGHVKWMAKQDIHGNDPMVNGKIWNILK